MHEAAVIALASALGAVMDGDTNVPDRTGNRHPALAMAPYNTYPLQRRLRGDLHLRPSGTGSRCARC